MAPLVAGIALLILLLVLMRGYIRTDTKELVKYARTTGAILGALFAVGLLIAGRFGFAVLAASAAWAFWNGQKMPWAMPWPRTGARQGARAAPPRVSMSRQEALRVLGLGEGASDDDIRAAYRRLIQQAHPDKGGSDYLAAKINEAKDVLLG